MMNSRLIHSLPAYHLGGSGPSVTPSQRPFIGRTAILVGKSRPITGQSSIQRRLLITLL